MPQGTVAKSTDGKLLDAWQRHHVTNYLTKPLGWYHSSQTVATVLYLLSDTHFRLQTVVALRIVVPSGIVE